MLVSRGTLDTVSLDSVIGMERFRDRYNHGRTFVYSTLATVGTFAAYIGVYEAVYWRRRSRLSDLPISPHGPDDWDFYTEGVRGKSMKGAGDTVAFQPEDATLLRALRTRHAAKDAKEKQFYRSRSPLQ
jgi:hypothetical protein